MKRRLCQTTFLTVLAFVVLNATALAQSFYQIERVSIATNGAQANNMAFAPSVSSDGRWVAFESYASNLVSGDTNGTYDIFVRDRELTTTKRVSVASGGAQGNESSIAPTISSDGRWIAFESDATNLVNGDTNAVSDIFIHDRQTGAMRRVSVSSGGVQGNDHSITQSISGNGRWIAFASYASNLVASDTNATTDIFVHDRQTGETTRVSVASNGAQANSYSGEPSISEDGRWVAFESGAENLVSGDNNGAPDIFVHDRDTGETTRVSIASDETQGNNGSFAPSISSDGRWIAFESYASNLVSDDTNAAKDIFLHDRETGETTRLSVTSNGTESNGISFSATISGDGLSVAFVSNAANLVVGDTNATLDIFVHHQQSGETARASDSTNGSQSNSLSDAPSISSDGHWIAFASPASNLVSGDTNNAMDVFIAGLFLTPVRNYFTTATPTLTWNRISGAADYKIEIDTDPNFGTSGHYARTVNALSHEVDSPLGSGIWYWRVRAVGGAWSPPERFVVDTP